MYATATVMKCRGGSEEEKALCQSQFRLQNQRLQSRKPPLVALAAVEEAAR